MESLYRFVAMHIGAYLQNKCPCLMEKLDKLELYSVAGLLLYFVSIFIIVSILLFIVYAADIHILLRYIYFFECFF